MAGLICPHCFQRANEKQLHRRCPEQCRADAVYFSCAAKQCPHGHTPSITRFCPNCKNRLEYDYITTKTNIIAMIGSAEAGKSTYVGVLIKELRNRIGADFNGMSAELVGDSSRSRYREVFDVPMYEEFTTLKRTHSARAERRLDPLLFMLRFPNARWRTRGHRLTAAMMIFYDTAGEDVLKEERMGPLAAYLNAADGIVLFVDPLQISSVRRVIGDSTQVPKSAPNQVDIIQRLGELLRAGRGLSPTQRIPTPLAVTLAKTDALNGVISEHSVLRRPGTHHGAYDNADGQHVHDETRALMSSWADGDHLLNTIDNTFSTYRYFGVSALGVPPASEGHISPSGIHPLRVEDPLLWLLGQFGLVPVRKAKK